jgi:hypothetical protein
MYRKLDCKPTPKMTPDKDTMEKKCDCITGTLSEPWCATHQMVHKLCHSPQSQEASWGKVRKHLEEVKDLIVKEINIARSEGEKTSRLTSLYNKLK